MQRAIQIVQLQVILYALAKGVGVQGFVVNGVIRDIAAIRELDFPVFSLGTTVAAGHKHGGGVVGCSGMLLAV